MMKKISSDIGKEFFTPFGVPLVQGWNAIWLAPKEFSINNIALASCAAA